LESSLARGGQKPTRELVSQAAESAVPQITPRQREGGKKGCSLKLPQELARIKGPRPCTEMLRSTHTCSSTSSTKEIWAKAWWHTPDETNALNQ